MPSTYTSGLRLTDQANGENSTTWGDIVDSNIQFLETAVVGIVTVDLTGGASHTLTANNGASDEARNALIYVKGVPSSANSVIIPASEKIYDLRFVHTSVSGGIKIRTNTGTGVAFNTSNTGRVYCDGVSVWSLAPPSLNPNNNLSDLTNVSAAVVNLGLTSFTSVSGFQSTLEVSSGRLGVNTSALFNIIWPIGSLYMNRTDSTNPGTLMGFGVWTSAGIGRVPVGVGTGVDANGVSVVVSAQTCGGEYVHTITTAEMPIHRHTYDHMARTGSGNQGNLATGSDLQRGVTSNTGYAGSSSAMPLRSPWFSVYFWQRTS